MVKALIFDVGGVLLELDIRRCRSFYIDRLGYERIDDILDSSIQKGIYMQLEGGQISPDQFRQGILKDSLPGMTPEYIDLAMWSLLKGVDSRKAEILKSLSDKYDLYILSNNNGITWPLCVKLMEDEGIEVNRVFKKIFLSYRMKMLKPGMEIFRAVIDQIGLPADELLFIDDSLKNVEGALKAGLPAIFYPAGCDMQTFLKEVLPEW